MTARSTTTGAVPVPLREYLRRLDAAARVLPVGDRQDLRADVWARIATAAGPAPTDARLTRVLDELGPPEDLVPRADRSPALLEPAVVHLLGSSFLTAGVTGVLGLVRVWRSPSWPTRHAVLATVLVVVGGVLLPALTPVHPVVGILLGGLGVGAPVAGIVLGAVLLTRRRRHRRATRGGHVTPG